MSGSLAVVLGTGRMAGGFVAPMLREAGWRSLLIGRDRRVVEAVSARGGIWVRLGTNKARWTDHVAAATWDEPVLARAIGEAELIATAVGPAALKHVGRALAPHVAARLERGTRDVTILTFENHRRAPELLASGMLAACSSLAPALGSRIRIAGVAVWRAIARRSLTDEGVLYEADDVDDAYVDGLALVRGRPPLDGSLPGLQPVVPFDDAMVEKLWLFSAGHAAAAWLGWHAGHETIDAAMRDPVILDVVTRVVAESALALESQRAHRPVACNRPMRTASWILQRYADPALGDPVSRVGREPRRKLAADDRLVGPALACLAEGIRPDGLARAIAAGLRYAEPGDLQAVDLQREIALLGAVEVLADVSGVAACDELTRLVVAELGAAEHSVAV